MALSSLPASRLSIVAIPDQTSESHARRPGTVRLLEQDTRTSEIRAGLRRDHLLARMAESHAVDMLVELDHLGRFRTSLEGIDDDNDRE